MDGIIIILPLLAGWILDRLFGDPSCLPHPVVWFGKAISFFEKKWNSGRHRRLKGGLAAVSLIITVFMLTWFVLHLCSSLPLVRAMVESIMIFYCLAATTLCHEVRDVFRAAGESLEKGRRQVARIVGRDTSALTGKEVRIAALETLAENLSDGVIAPLFWYALLGLPGMVAYKMVNTLDSMIGYRMERYRLFGCVAARIDDVVNYIPARVTAFLMVMASGRMSLLKFVRKYGLAHASPNSGFPEAALAGILDCRFGGPHDYFGEKVEKPYIGINDRDVTCADMATAVAINRKAEVMMLVLTAVVRLLL